MASKKVQHLVGITRFGGGWIQEPQNDLRIKEMVSQMMGVQVYVTLREDLDKATQVEKVRYEQQFKDIASKGEATFTASRRPVSYGGNARGMAYNSITIGHEPFVMEPKLAVSLISRYPEMLQECDIDEYRARKALQKKNEEKAEAEEPEAKTRLGKPRPATLKG